MSGGAIPYERIVAQDLNLGYGQVDVTMPAGGTAQGDQLGIHTFIPAMLSVRDFGAIGDGLTDDTASFQAALDQLAADGGGTLLVPNGTFILRPPASGSTILTLNTTNLRISGVGTGQSILRVGSSAGPYRAILGGVITNTDLSHLEVDHLTFDHNVAQNPISNGASIAAHPAITILVFAGADVSLHHNEVINASSINNFVVNGVTCTRVRICDNTFRAIGDDPNHVSHDCSVIYADADDVVISRNQFVSTGQDGPGVTTAIETHGSRIVVSENTILNWQTGMNITGIAARGSSISVVIANNSLSGCCLGIMLWSAPLSTHTSGYGLDGVTVTGNTVNLSGTAAWATKNASHFEIGIGIYPSSPGLDANNITISNNVVTHPLETVAVPNNTVSFGIGWYSPDLQTLSNSRISGNVVTNMPMAGIRLSCQVLNVTVSGNSIINCGSTLSHDYVGTLAYRIPLYIGGTSLYGLQITDNVFRDSLTEVTWRPAEFVYLAQILASVGAGIEIVGNSFLSTGSAMTSQIFLDNLGGTLMPLLRGDIPNFSTAALGGSAQKFALGSYVMDVATGIKSAVQPNQFTWTEGLLQSTIAPVRAKRYASDGTLIVNGDWQLTGWGAGATFAVAGSDQAPLIQITCGAAPSVNPVAALTFHDGAWASVPGAVAQMTGGSGFLNPLPPLIVSCSQTTLSLQYFGTPVAGFVYQLQAIVMGRP